MLKYTIFANVLIVFGLLLYYALPPIINLYINKQISLEPSSQTYPMWLQPPVPIYQKFYFYNVTNAIDIEQRGHKPVLQEIGPFTYRSVWTKREIQLDDIKNTISFKHFKEWHFEPDLSIADHRVQLVTLNAPLAITLSLIQSASNAVRLLVTFSLDGLSDGFFTKRSVKQLLFDGYPDLLTTFGPLLNAEMLSQGGHFGYMNARNNSQDGFYEINTGTDDIRKLNTINRYNGRTKLPYWYSGAHSHSHNHNNGNNRHGRHNGAHTKHNHGISGHCNALDGSTTGEMFPPIEAGQRSIKLFQPDFCRVWRLDSDGSEFETADGLKLRRFIATRDVFRNASDLAENTCFFSSKHMHTDAAQLRQFPSSRRPGRTGRQQASHNGNQRAHLPPPGRREWPAGVFTLAPCKFNAPIFMSMPHFLDADPYFASQVDGLEPDRNKHEFYVDLEPRTGSPVMMSARVQLNVAISKPPGLVRFRNIPEIMFPVFWQELTVNVSKSSQAIDQLQLASHGAIDANYKIACVFLILGAVILIANGVFYLNDRLLNKPVQSVAPKKQSLSAGDSLGDTTKTSSTLSARDSVAQ